MLTAEEVAEEARKKREIADIALEKGMVAAQARFKDFSQEQIAAIYRKGGQVPPTGRMITPEMTVPVGLIAQNKWPTEYRWSATRIAQILPNNLIKIQSLESKRYFGRNRNTLSLAPDFVEQPGVDKIALKEFRKLLKGGSAGQPAKRSILARKSGVSNVWIGDWPFKKLYGAHSTIEPSSIPAAARRWARPS